MRRIGAIGLALLLPLALLLLLGTPPEISPEEDALLHAAVACGLTLALLLALAVRGARLFAVLGLVAGAALISELAQMLLTANRSASLEDLLADLAGAAVAFGLYLVISARSLRV